MSDIDPIMKKPRRGGRRKKDDHGIPESVLDQLLADYSQPEDLTGPDGLMIRLKKALIERAMSAELSTTWATRRETSPLTNRRIVATAVATRRCARTTVRCRSG